MESQKTIVGKCPRCGGDVVKTLKGYACANSLSDNPSCNFFLFSTVGNRRFSDDEARELLEKKRILLDGFVTKEGKNFTSILNFNEDGTVNMTSHIGTCPKCGGVLYVGAKAVSCGNFKNPQQPCNFTIWRNTSGHEFTLRELEEIIDIGAIQNLVDAYDIQGNKQSVRFGLNDNKEVVTL